MIGLDKLLMSFFSLTCLGGITRTTPMESDGEYTFELFMCVALLKECREALMKCVDAAMVFNVIYK